MSLWQCSELEAAPSSPYHHHHKHRSPRPCRPACRSAIKYMLGATGKFLSLSSSFSASRGQEEGTQEEPLPPLSPSNYGPTRTMGLQEI